MPLFALATCSATPITSSDTRPDRPVPSPGESQSPSAGHRALRFDLLARGGQAESGAMHVCEIADQSAVARRAARRGISRSRWPAEAVGEVGVADRDQCSRAGNALCMVFHSSSVKSALDATSTPLVSIPEVPFSQPRGGAEVATQGSGLGDRRRSIARLRIRVLQRAVLYSASCERRPDRRSHVLDRRRARLLAVHRGILRRSGRTARCGVRRGNGRRSRCARRPSRRDSRRRGARGLQLGPSGDPRRRRSPGSLRGGGSHHGPSAPGRNRHRVGRSGRACRRQLSRRCAQRRGAACGRPTGATCSSVRARRGWPGA